MWYVMSYNHIQGLVWGAFNDYDMFFLIGFKDDSGNAEWTPVISKAKGFETLEAAKRYVHDIWGDSFSSSAFLFAEYDPKYGIDQRMEEQALEVYQERQETGRRLASRQMTKDDLIREALAPYTVNNKFTPRERWIIEIMNKETEANG